MCASIPRPPTSPLHSFSLFSPVGYEHADTLTVTRQLVVGGRNKYLINGHAAQPSRVANLFHSVQLNVNNPHFLIMQGRITKVLNMKPPEILGMLEEAAGTRMYESKKEAALRTLERKQLKVDEIDKVLGAEILPALDRLRLERADYLEWQASNAKLDRLRRFCAAYKHVEAGRAAQGGAEAAEAARAQAGALKQEADDVKAALKDADAEAARLEADRERAAGGEARRLAAVADDLGQRCARAGAAAEAAADGAASADAEVRALEAAIAGLGSAELAAKAAAAVAARDEAASAAAAAEAAVPAAEAELAGAEAGDGRDGSGRSLAQRAGDARAGAAAAQAAAAAADVTAAGLAKQVAAARAEVEAATAGGGGLDGELVAATAAAARADAALAAAAGRGGGGDRNPSAIHEALLADADGAAAAVAAARDGVDAISASLSGLAFHYRHPGGSFSDASVRGPLARLVRVADPARHAVALDVVAGGKLWQVVVDTDADAKALLARGALRSRVTLVPLNRVQGRGAAPGAARAAAAATPAGAAAHALDLVACEPAIRPAAAYAFGGAFVCADAATARALAFAPDPGARARCVTLDGDDFNPGGTLTGGSRPSGGSILARLAELAEAEAALAAATAALRDARAAAEAAAPAAAAHAAAAAEAELKRHALALLRERAASGAAAAAAAAVAEGEAALATARAAAADSRDRSADLLAQADALEAEAAQFAARKGEHLEAARARLAAAKAGVEPARAAARAAALAADEAAAEAEAAGVQRAEAEQRLAPARAAAAAAAAAAVAAAGTAAATQAEATAAAAALEAHRAHVRACDEDLKELAARRAALEARAAEAALEATRLQREAVRLDREAEDAGAAAARLEAEFPWIPGEARAFGVAGGDYDFDARPGGPGAAFEELAAAEAAQASKARAVNRRVMQMYDKAESEFRELSAKKGIVSADREKIRAVIAELDEKKRAALEKTWTKVAADFGSIFSTLLPGTGATLAPPEGAASFLDGLEVRVAFNGVWKASLTELSGGQRSLLALALILAMLLFKPAPIYILDEVDAALDLSHTQNIGRMIREHFPYSQFIVVSLKEGMFANANVLFRTRFADGVSGVQRFCNAAAAAAAAGGGGKEVGGGGGVGGARARQALSESNG